jgi:hypothetical protein
MAEILVNQDNTQEYSLIDLIAVIIKHRKLFVYTVLVITFLGAVLAGINHFNKQYIYRQPVQLASYYLEGKQYLLQGNQQVISAINNLYLPRFIASYKVQHPNFNEIHFEKNFSVQATFIQTEDQNVAPSSMIYLEYKGSQKDLEAFQAATNSIVQQVIQQEQPMISSLVTASKSDLQLLQTEVPKLEKVGELLKSYSADPSSNAHQEIAMTVSTRETYLDLISQSQTVQNVITFKQTINQLNQKIDSLTSTSMAALIVMNAKSTVSGVSLVLLSFIVGLFVAILLVFTKVISTNVREQLKLTK